MFSDLGKALVQELESPQILTRPGTGWISGVLGLFLAMAGLAAVICLRYPQLLTAPEIRAVIDLGLFRIFLHGLLITGFLVATISLVLRQNKFLGLTAVTLILIAVSLGGSKTTASGELSSGVYFGLDWFVLNLTLTGMIFLPLERLFRRVNQSVFRTEWREDLFYFLISSILVQSLTFLSLAPSMYVLANVQLAPVQSAIGSQPLWLQFLEVMFLTDLVQYWVHRLFHRVPFLWKFHAVHHSA